MPAYHKGIFRLLLPACLFVTRPQQTTPEALQDWCCVLPRTRSSHPVATTNGNFALLRLRLRRNPGDADSPQTVIAEYAVQSLRAPGLQGATLVRPDRKRSPDREYALLHLSEKQTSRKEISSYRQEHP